MRGAEVIASGIGGMLCDIALVAGAAMVGVMDCRRQRRTAVALSEYHLDCNCKHIIC